MTSVINKSTFDALKMFLDRHDELRDAEVAKLREQAEKDCQTIKDLQHKNCELTGELEVARRRLDAFLQLSNELKSTTAGAISIGGAPATGANVVCTAGPITVSEEAPKRKESERPHKCLMCNQPYGHGTLSRTPYTTCKAACGCEGIGRDCSLGAKTGNVNDKPCGISFLTKWCYRCRQVQD